MPPDDVSRDLARLRDAATPLPQRELLLRKHSGPALAANFHGHATVAAHRLVAAVIRSAAEKTDRWSCTTVSELEQRCLEVAKDVLVAAMRAAPSDELRFDLLYAHFGARVLRYFVRKCREPRYRSFEPDDLTQETLVRIGSNLPQLDLRSYPELSGWVFKIAWRELRRQWKREHAGKRDIRRVEAGVDPAELEIEQDEPEQPIELHEFIDLIAAWMTAEQRRVCELLLRDLSIDEVATELGKTRNAVDSILKRIRQRLTERLLTGLAHAEDPSLVQHLLKGSSLDAIAAELRIGGAEVRQILTRLRAHLRAQLHPSVVTFLFKTIGLDRLDGEQEASA